MSEEVLVLAAKLRCSKAVDQEYPSYLMLPQSHSFEVMGQSVVGEMDSVRLVNILPFGQCQEKINRGEKQTFCDVPEISNWFNPHESCEVAPGIQQLTLSSYCICQTYEGYITPNDSGQGVITPELVNEQFLNDLEKMLLECLESILEKEGENYKYYAELKRVMDFLKSGQWKSDENLAKVQISLSTYKDYLKNKLPFDRVKYLMNTWGAMDNSIGAVISWLNLFDDLNLNDEVSVGIDVVAMIPKENNPFNKIFKTNDVSLAQILAGPNLLDFILSYHESSKEQQAIMNATNSTLATIEVTIKDSKTRTITTYSCTNTTDGYHIEIHQIDVPNSSLSRINGDPFDDATGIDINWNGFGEVVDIDNIKKDE